MKHIKLVISDCHLSAGHQFESRKNPHEDFYFDDELVDFIEYFSKKAYGPDIDLELIINGDFFDFLNVPYRGEFEEMITEQFALYKLECILAGHPKVFQALRNFLTLPNKKLTFNIGNHDAELFFKKVRDRIIEFLAPSDEKNKVEIIYDKEWIDLPGGVQIHHGNQLEAVHWFDYENPFIKRDDGEPILALPWGSFYVLKIVNRLKWEREYVDKVRPIRAMILWGLIFDTWFTLKFAFLSIFYFMKTRFVYSPNRRSRLSETIKIFKQQMTTFLQNLEKQARELLDLQPDVNTIIMGHTHLPMMKVYPDDKIYLNTGTWTKMIYLDLKGIGTRSHLTFALIEYDDSLSQDSKNNRPKVSLREWIGEHKPHVVYDY